MKFAADVGAPRRSGYALPARRPDIGINANNRQTIHLRNL